jgi:Mn2+/Fe2+ NRAMP family transporter
LLAGLSDDDPAGITTYSILGAKFGYRLLWVLALSTLALIVFHELGARMGVVTGKACWPSCASATAHAGPAPS